MESGDDVTDQVTVVLARLRSVMVAQMVGVVLFGVAGALLANRGTFAFLSLPTSAMLITFLAVAGLQVAASSLGRRAGSLGGIEQRTHHALPGYQARVMVRLAVREGAGILGLVVAVGSARADWVLAFAALTLVGLAVGWPTRAELERLGGGSG